jgi:hypothetical protein
MIPVLNAGYIEVSSVINDSNKIKNLEKDKNTLIREDLISEMGVLSLKIRLPFFLKANLARHIESIVDITDQGHDFYIPSIDHLTRGTLAEKTERLDRIKEALSVSAEILNSPYHDSDTQLEISCLTPSSIYCTIIATGSLNSWLKFVDQKNTPIPFRAYAIKIKEILTSLWVHLV